MYRQGSIEEYRARVDRTRANVAACERLTGRPCTDSEYVAVLRMVARQMEAERKAVEYVR